MRTVYALLVGIDDYPGARLRGCVNDVRAAQRWLRERSGLACGIRTLLDGEATRAAVLAGIEDHLGRGGPDDTALLWFSGHGSERDTDDPREATGRAQALVCHDSLAAGGQPLLQDAELGVLLDRIAARGTHVVAVLDCCHAGGATRDGVPGRTARSVSWRPWWRTAEPGGARGAGGPGPQPREHILLAACRPQEGAHEDRLGDEVRGHFSHALLDALALLGPDPTYGTLHARVEARVRDLVPGQHPELRGLENARFLYGDTLPSAPFHLRYTAAGWEVNCGQAHGLRAAGAEFTLLGDGPSPRRVVACEVRPESALVRPAGWLPSPGDRESVYGVTPSALAFPPAAVTVTGDPAAVRLVARAVEAAPALSLGGDGLPLRVAVRDGLARVSGAAGRPLPALPLRSPGDAERVAACLTHLTHWHRLRDLVSPDPWLSSLIRVTVEETPVGRLRRTADGEIVCSYTPDHRPPQVGVRVHNDSGVPLWCVLLDLTDSYACSPQLYPGDFVGPGRAGRAMRGQPVWLYLPRGSAVVPGAFTRDRLRVIAAENELNLAPFRLDAWSSDAPQASRGGSAAGDGPLRLTGPSGGRDAGGPAAGVGRWGTAHVDVRTQVP
ncbi:caspase family protein [Streptomyces sp. JB150]|uniref:caspase family protein n=1 Tax=Streptomyces sp. JB150 TaxID=2714844 RepID=UPI00140A7CD4|nr:caspase family protein [Streptomyces sp. JB150]QIJ65525.1 caspase family protein [Streptomyces sp. JB150]